MKIAKCLIPRNILPALYMGFPLVGGMKWPYFPPGSTLFTCLLGKEGNVICRGGAFLSLLGFLSLHLRNKNSKCMLFPVDFIDQDLHFEVVLVHVTWSPILQIINHGGFLFSSNLVFCHLTRLSNLHVENISDIYIALQLDALLTYVKCPMLTNNRLQNMIFQTREDSRGASWNAWNGFYRLLPLDKLGPKVQNLSKIRWLWEWALFKFQEMSL